MVPGAGLEPARCCQRKILSLVCLPISPPGHRVYCAGLATWFCLIATLRVALCDHFRLLPNVTLALLRFVYQFHHPGIESIVQVW